ncbi:MAG: M20/M25/M40 family metallo-hydrolase [Actinobacteria bacterium]|nr:M20/M25/M40 family metallo-hydrolase [Actinomycetota bacterium]
MLIKKQGRFDTGERQMRKDSIFMNLINKERLLNTFFEILRIKSPSKNEKEIIEYISEILKKLGLKVYKDDCGVKFNSNSGNITCYLPSNDDRKRIPIFLGAHVDTVSLNGEVIPVLKNGKVLNKNKNCILGGDDKVAVAAILEAARVIVENSLRTGEIFLIFTISEEAMILGAKYLDLKKVGAEYGFVFDGEGDIGTIFDKAPYHNSIEIEITGKAAHAGTVPEKGISSIKAASDAISRLKLGRIDSETTCNIGIINGGVATNIIPERTEIKAEARSLKLFKLQKITDRIKSTFQDSARNNKARIKIKVEREYDGFKIGENEKVILIAKKAIQNMGIKPKIKPTGGGSDVNIFNAKGKKSITLSSAMENVHSNNEYVKVRELLKLSALILEICSLT